MFWLHTLHPGMGSISAIIRVEIWLSQSKMQSALKTCPTVIIDLADSISTDTLVYAIHYIKPNNSTQLKFGNF